MENVRARIRGFPFLVRTLLESCLSDWPERTRDDFYDARLDDLYARFASFVDNADLVLRAPLDRMQRIVALTATGVIDGKRHAVTVDIDLEEHDRLRQLELLLKRAIDVLHPRKATDATLCHSGCEPVPVILADE